MAVPQELNNWYSGKTQSTQNTGLLATKQQQPYLATDTPAQRQAKVEANTGLKVLPSDTPQQRAAKVLAMSTNGGVSTALYNKALKDMNGDIGKSLGWDGTREGAFKLVGSAAENKLVTNQSNEPVSNSYRSELLGKPEQWKVTPEQTMQGQLNTIMSKDSPLMQMARTKGLQQANQRGLLNSSMAIGAAQDSVINAATPIAQFDADINSKATAYNADTQNSFTKLNQQAINDERQFNTQAFNRASEFIASNEFNKDQALFDANVQASLKQIENEHDFDKQMQNIVGGMSNDFNKLMIQINQDTNMNQQSKDYTIKQLFETYKAQLSMLSAIGSVPDVADLLEVEYINTEPSTSTKTTNIPQEFQGL